MFALPPQLIDGIRVGRGVLKHVTITTSNTDQTIVHNLGRIPVGYWQIQSVNGSYVYNGANNGTDWTGKNIVLRWNWFAAYLGDTVWIIIF